MAISFSCRLRHDVALLEENQPIKFTADLNDGNGYSNVNGTFTAPVNGLYSLSFAVAHRNPGSPLAVQLKINDVTLVGAVTDSASPLKVSQASNHAVVKMMTGETAQVVVSDHQAQNIAAGCYTSFSGHLYTTI